MRKIFARAAAAAILLLVVQTQAEAQTGYDDEDSVYYLARVGDLEQLKERLATHPELIRASDSVFHKTLLHWAAVSGQAETIAYLLSHPGRPDLDEKSEWGRTAFHEAALRGRNEAVRVFVRHGIDLDARSDNGRRALHYALGNESVSFNAVPQRLETIRLLVRAGADPNARDDAGFPPLYWGGLLGNTEAIRTLLDAAPHTNVNVQWENGDTPLHQAVRRGGPARIGLLMERAADPFVQNEEGFTASDIAFNAAVRDTLEALIREHYPQKSRERATAAAQESRDLSRPATRLVGHWKSTTAAGSHVYFRPVNPQTGEGQVIETRSDGERAAYPYRVLRESSTEVVLRVEDFRWGKPGTTETWHVSSDGERLILRALNTPEGERIFAFQAVYVDARTAPAED